MKLRVIELRESVVGVVRVSVNIFKNSYSYSLSQHCDGSTVNVGAMIPKF